MASAHIRDLASALRIIANIYDEIAWMRYLQLWEKIGDVTASKLINELLELSNIEECLALLKNKDLKDPNLINTLSAIKNLNNKPSNAIRMALTNMESRLAFNYKEEWERKRKPDFQIFMKLAEKHGSIGEFIAEYVLDPQLNESYNTGSDIKDKVTISTIHSAKGLESKVCYVINVSVGAYPSSRSVDEGVDAIEEERRVLYVALTRAKDELYVTRVIQKIQNYNAISKLGHINSASDNHISNEIAEQTKDENGNPIIYFLDELPSELTINEISEQTKNEISTKTYTGKIIAENDFGMDLS